VGLWTFFYHNKKLNNTNYESKTTTNVETDTLSLRSSSFFFFFFFFPRWAYLSVFFCRFFRRGLNFTTAASLFSLFLLQKFFLC